jgi:hypothetical protein
MSLIFFFILVTVFVQTMESQVATPSWVLFMAFAVFTAIIKDNSLSGRGESGR